MTPKHYDEQERLRRLLHAKRIDIDDGVVVIGDSTGYSLGNADVYFDNASYALSIADLESIVHLSETTEEFKGRVKAQAKVKRT